MHWSVSAQASGDRELSREEIVELADAVAPAGGVASGIGQTAYGAQLLVEAETREAAIERGASIFTAAAARAGLPRLADQRDQRALGGRRRGRRTVIRLGSLAGYPFEGPRVLAGWTVPRPRRCTP